MISGMTLTNDVYDGLVLLVTDTLNGLDRKNFASRREFLGRAAELSEMLDQLQLITTSK